MQKAETGRLPAVTIFFLMTITIALVIWLTILELSPWLVAAIGVVLLIASPAVAVLFHRHFIPINVQTGTLVIPIAVGLALLTSVAAGFLFSGSGQVFASFGAVKKIAIPATFVVFLFAALTPSLGSSVKIPKWWWSLLAILVGSFVLEVLIPRQDVGLSPVFQGIALISSVLLISFVAFRCPDLSEMAWIWLLAILIGAALLASLTGISLGVFVALQVPIATLLAVIAFRGSRHRLLALVGAVVIGVQISTKVVGNATASSALILQIIVCVGIVTLVLIPRRPRLLLAVVAAVLGVIYLFANGTVALMAGRSGDETDVTLVHRAYEAQQVYIAMAEHPLSLLLGLGPGATVNLVASPDVLTLEAAGRDLSAVDDVHFLMVWILLKFGVFGAVWFVALICVLVRLTWRTLNADKVPILDVGLLLFVLAGLITALPAATHLFANPLPFLCLALLHSRVLPRNEPPAAVSTTGLPKRIVREG
jgi:hypothetical protein